MRLFHTLRRLAAERPVADVGTLLGDQTVDPAKVDLGRPVAAQLRAERTADDDVVSRERIDAGGNDALTELAPDNPCGGTRTDLLGEVHAHGGIVGEDKANTPEALQVIESTDSLRAVFDPDRLQGGLEFNLPATLRTLADSIEAGDMHGILTRFYCTASNSYPGDSRIHTHVNLRFSTEIRKEIAVYELEASK